MKSLPVGIHCLERGVYLRVYSSGKRGWLFKFQLNGRRRELGLGGIDQPITSVQAKAAQARALLAQGIDPVEARHDETEKRKTSEIQNRCPTFQEFIEPTMRHVEYVRQFTGKSTKKSWECTLNAIARQIGTMRLDAITRDDVAAVLRTVWTDHPRTGRDYLNRLNALFDLAVSKGFIKANPAAWKGGLDGMLPSLSVVRRSKPEKHHAAVSPDCLRGIAKSLLALSSESQTARLLLVIMLTACRFNEIRGAQWSEIDEKAETLTVPQSRRKDRKPEPFVVPLPRQAMALIRESPTTGGKFVFEGRDPFSAVGNTSAFRMLNRIFDGDITVHGFRSTFSDWCAQNDKPFIVSEKCLMHSVGGKVFMAYQRDDLLEKRRKLLQEWADFLLG